MSFGVLFGGQSFLTRKSFLIAFPWHSSRNRGVGACQKIKNPHKNHTKAAVKPRNATIAWPSSKIAHRYSMFLAFERHLVVPQPPTHHLPLHCRLSLSTLPPLSSLFPSSKFPPPSLLPFPPLSLL